jgi:hypothetical protein
MKRLSVAAIFASAYLLTASAIHGAFTKVGEITIPFSRLTGITFDGTNFHIGEGQSGRFHTFDSEFNYLSTTTLPGLTELVGLTYDPHSNHLFVGDHGGIGTVREITLTGTTVQQFTAANVTNLA